MSLIVQKYGGSSLATNEAIARVALSIKSHYLQGHKLCVVVSAMGKTTNALLSRAHSLAKSPVPRELDMLLTCGERISMSLLAIALNAIDIPSLSLTGSQAGIITSDAHRAAKILNIQPKRVVEALNSGNVVIIAGFQGVTQHSKEITTLSRGGSDTTAVHMAAALGARTCEIYTDVAGVYTNDPHINEDAKLLSHLTYGQMQELADSGARVLHPDAVQAAQKLGIRVIVKKTGGNGPGTVVDNCHFSEFPSDLCQNSSAQGVN